MWIYIFISITFILYIIYAAIILLYRKWFCRLKEFDVAPDYKAQTTFSVIIPARNEAENIEHCISSILYQNYPTHLFEVIVIDDHSTDETPYIIERLQQQHPNLQLIKLEQALKGKQLNAYKKKAIEIAIGTSKYDWVVTTDADCLATENWLRNYDAYIQQYNPVFAGAPVAYTNTGTVLSTFQCIDFMTMQAVTAAAVSAGFHAMCNGANLTYKKEAFYSVGGFKGIDNIASGDDMLLMSKMKKEYPDRIGFVFSKESIITTDPMPNWKSFFNQRIRWASKSDQYKDKSIIVVLLLMYLFNVSLFIMPVLAIFNVTFLIYWLIFLILKTIVEASFAKRMSVFFGFKMKWYYALLQMHHVVYMVVAGWLGKFGTYQWKGRQVK